MQTATIVRFTPTALRSVAKKDRTYSRPRLPPVDYGFKGTRVVIDGKIPKGIIPLWLDALKYSVSPNIDQGNGPRTALEKLTLSNEEVWKKEKDMVVEAPLPMMLVYYGICYALDFMYKDSPIQRFYFLETIARLPYYSYTNILHMYETLGLWMLDSNTKVLHMAEEANENYHLQIMEALGGGQLWRDRFIAQHVSVAYFIVLVILFLFNPRLAYNSSELLETHAIATYTQFLEENEDILKACPPPDCCVEYVNGKRIPKMSLFQNIVRANFKVPFNLYDVFENIRDDECAHTEAMNNLKNLPDV